MEEEQFLLGMPVARDAQFAPASTSDRPLPKNATTLVAPHIWQKTNKDSMCVHATWSLRDGNLAVLLTNTDNHLPTRSNQPVEECHRRKNRRDSKAPTTIGCAISRRQLPAHVSSSSTTIKPLANSSCSSTSL